MLMKRRNGSTGAIIRAEAGGPPIGVEAKGSGELGKARIGAKRSRGNGEQEVGPALGIGCQRLPLAGHRIAPAEEITVALLEGGADLPKRGEVGNGHERRGLARFPGSEE